MLLNNCLYLISMGLEFFHIFIFYKTLLTIRNNAF